MTSKEALEQLRKYNGIGLCGDYTLFEPIEKDLCLLEILKHIIEIVYNTKDTAGPRYYINLRQNVFITDETKKMLKEWLNERQEN